MQTKKNTPPDWLSFPRKGMKEIAKNAMGARVSKQWDHKEDYNNNYVSASLYLHKETKKQLVVSTTITGTFVYKEV